MNKQPQSPWETFAKSGKIDDYLAYCQDKKAAAHAPTKEEMVVQPHAADNTGDYPAAIQG